ncbi:uncharacterized protein A4U43_C05F33270 [Asparagus officinalis]|uniref:Uncharacterized protein n=1 Tax=Asparagus officinalis TaxID=4686 RepID=A0A5P1EWD3_ASPOF|nr:uncharacterized protein A4U43_C05F33270 [Asparagus officinalis]
MLRIVNVNAKLEWKQCISLQNGRSASLFRSISRFHLRTPSNGGGRWSVLEVGVGLRFDVGSRSRRRSEVGGDLRNWGRDLGRRSSELGTRSEVDGDLWNWGRDLGRRSSDLGTRFGASEFGTGDEI